MLIDSTKQALAGDNTTVRNFFKDLADNPKVCSVRLCDYVPEFNGKGDCYMFAADNEILVVHVDVTEKVLDELAGEDKFNGDDPLYFTEFSHRVSPVFRLTEVSESLRACVERHSEEPFEMMALLLTTSNLLNSDEMEDDWHTIGVTVRHKFKYFGDGRLPVCENPDSFAEFQWVKWCAEDKIVMPGKAIYDSAEFDDSEDSEDCEYPGFHLGSYMDKPNSEPEKENLNTRHFGDIDDYVDHSDPEFSDEITGFDANGSQIKMQTKAEMPAVRILEPLSDPEAVLKTVVGLDQVKEHIRNLSNMAIYNTTLHDLDESLPEHSLNLHSLFLGASGIGKTTMARIYGSLLHSAGVLSSGHVVLSDRSSYVGRYFGEEEKAVRRVLKVAKGGVLVIDEAYLLVTASENDPGRLVLPLMLDLLADEAQRDIAVVLCGYTKLMDGLLSINPGLKSRFVNRIEFPEYSLDELLKIARMRINMQKYTFTKGAWTKFSEEVKRMYDQRDRSQWANAREVINYLERLYIAHANRCVASRISDKRILKIIAKDIPQGTLPTASTRIGFSPAC